MIKSLLIFCLSFTFLIQCKNAKVSAPKLSLSDSTLSDTSESVQLALKEKASSEKQPDIQGTLISTIYFKVKTDSLADFPDGFIPNISMEYPGKEIKRLIDKDKIVLKDSIVTIIIDYPLKNLYKFVMKSTRGFTSEQLVSQISNKYHQIYTEEEATATTKTIPLNKRTKMYNRNETNGKYGIWGHDLADLVLADILVFRTDDGHIILSLEMES